jgi:hypothetical protein
LSFHFNLMPIFTLDIPYWTVNASPENQYKGTC